MSHTSSETQLAEMSPADHALLLRALRDKKPRKVLEVGVSAGGTTALLLDALPKESVLFSVDIETSYYVDPSKPVGFVAEAMYDSNKHPHWVRIWGKDISLCIEDEIGSDIDFVVLDTRHALPGEVLSFLAILPYLDDDSVLFLHDTGMHSMFKAGDGPVSDYHRHGYACSLLFSAIFSKEKYLSKDLLPNSGVIVIDPQYVADNLYPIIDALFFDWYDLPPPPVLVATVAIARKVYSRRWVDLLIKAIQYNLRIRNVRLPGLGG